MICISEILCSIIGLDATCSYCHRGISSLSWVGVCMCGFYNVLGVCMCGFCNVLGVLVIYVFVFTVNYIVCTVFFVLFRLCILFCLY